MAFLERAALHPQPLRVALLRCVVREMKIGTYAYRASIDAVVRPQYAYCIIEAAKLARDMGLSRISAIEFGVAGGNGLVNIETHVAEVRKEFGVDFEVYGFDSGLGMPASDDYRDVLYTWGEGFYEMDRPALEKRLSFARLVIGDIRETARTFHQRYKPAPIGCCFFDMDYFTSTTAAFGVFDTIHEQLLPRIPCHFDDISCTNAFLGELCAINDFNDRHETVKIAAHHLLRDTRRVPMAWNDEIYYLHDFAHPRYNECFRNRQQLRLEPAR